ncbi:unnamed protein product [Camellia sinensis]
MEFDTKYREDLSYQPSLLSNNYLKPEIDKDFYFESSSSNGFFFHDLHHLDQFSFNGLNPEFCVQTICFDPFDPFTSNCSPNLDDFYESKPFAHSGVNNGTNEAANGSGGGGGGGGGGSGGGGGYLNYPKKTPGDAAESGRRYEEEIKPVKFVIPPDQGSSCITAENSGASAAPPTRKPCKGRKKSNSVKGQWTIEEDRELIEMVEKYGVRKWSQIAEMMEGGRIGKQCRERWHNHLRPDIKKDTWSEEEDKILIQTHTEVGNKWAEIAKRLPGRTENSVKNHWNATKRRQYSKRKCRTKNPRPSSLLQNYIKSLNLDGKFDTNAKNALATEKLFEESSILLDQMPSPPPVDDEKSFEMEVPLDRVHVASFMKREVKKEKDLMEMITQVNL